MQELAFVRAPAQAPTGRPDVHQLDYSSPESDRLHTLASFIDSGTDARVL